jgi:hypothetical protein
MIRSTFARASLALLLALAPQVSHAQWAGAQVGLDYRFTDKATIFAGNSFGTRSVGAGLEYGPRANVATTLTYFSLDFDASLKRVTLNYWCEYYVAACTFTTAGTNGFPGPVAFNGWHLFDALGVAADFKVATVLSSNGGFTQSRLTYDDDNLWFDMQGLNAQGTQAQPWQVVVELSDVSSVPEPASFALLGTGLAGLAAVTRRRR